MLVKEEVNHEDSGWDLVLEDGDLLVHACYFRIPYHHYFLW